MWFEPRPAWVEAAKQAGGDAASTAGVALDQAAALKALLWDAFSSSVAGEEAEGVSLAAPAAAAALTTTNSGSSGRQVAVPPLPLQQLAATALPTGVPPECAATNEGTGPQGEPLLDWRAVLLYCCADRDHATGVRKALAVAAGTPDAPACATAAVVWQVVYPTGADETASHLQRPLATQEHIAAALRAAAEVPPAAAPPPTPGRGAAAPTAATASITGVRLEQLLYSAACERVLGPALSRYQRTDVYSAARA